jgi:hypothetical protein
MIHISDTNLFSKIKEKSSLIFYSEMKQEWAREQHISCSRTEISGLAWLKLVSGS